MEIVSPYGIFVGKDWDHMDNIILLSILSKWHTEHYKLSHSCIKWSNDVSSCTHNPYGGSPQTPEFLPAVWNNMHVYPKIPCRGNPANKTPEYSPRCILGTVFCPTRRPSRCDVPSPSYFYPDFYPHCVVTSLEKGILRYFLSPKGYFSLTKSKEFSFKLVEFCVFYFFHTFCSFMGAKGVFCPPQISLL